MRDSKYFFLSLPEIIIIIQLLLHFNSLILLKRRHISADHKIAFWIQKNKLNKTANSKSFKKLPFFWSEQTPNLSDGTKKDTKKHQSFFLFDCD